VLVVISVFLFISCGDSIDSELNEKLAGANKIKLYFFDKEHGTVKDPKMIVTVSKQGDIKKIINSITGETTKQFKCGYSGQLEIFKDNTLLLNPEFNFEEECRHYVFMYNGNMLFKVMSEEGSNLLKEYFDKAKSE
jgi:hypothetical protein